MSALPSPSDLNLGAPQSDAAHLVARHRRERDLIGLIRRQGEVLLCYALPRPEGKPAATECPVCGATGFIQVPLPRPKAAPKRAVTVDCPLCLGMGLVEPGYSDFSTCYQSADLHDVRAMTREDGRVVRCEHLPTDRLFTLAEAHACLMREAA